MPHATADDGVKLYFEETGSGKLVVFVHEFAANNQSWELQMRHFGRRYRCAAFAARGYPPSDVPERPSSYSQHRAADDIVAIIKYLGESKGHIVGLSMGGFAALHFGFRHPNKAHSLCIGGCGYGAELNQRERFRGEAEAIASIIKTEGLMLLRRAMSLVRHAFNFRTRIRAALPNSGNCWHGIRRSAPPIRSLVFRRSGPRSTSSSMR